MRLAVAGVLSLLVVCSLQTPRFQNCKDSAKDDYDLDTCVGIECAYFEDDTYLHNYMRFEESCPEPICYNGTFIGITDYDYEKVFPDCCRKPKCAPSEGRQY